jgi:hypothetical protein
MCIVIVLFLLGFHLGGLVAIFMLLLPLTRDWARSFTMAYFWPVWVTHLFTGYWRKQ